MRNAFTRRVTAKSSDDIIPIDLQQSAAASGGVARHADCFIWLMEAAYLCIGRVVDLHELLDSPMEPTHEEDSCSQPMRHQDERCVLGVSACTHGVTTVSPIMNWVTKQKPLVFHIAGFKLRVPGC